jgi:hypothetical protein
MLVLYEQQGTGKSITMNAAARAQTGHGPDRYLVITADSLQLGASGSRPPRSGSL